MSIPGTIKSERLTRFGTVGIRYIRGHGHVYRVSCRLRRKEDRKNNGQKASRDSQQVR